MSRSRVTGAVVAAVIGLPTAMVVAAGPASAATSCSVYNYTGAHWATSVSRSAVVTHAYQLNLPHNGTFTETRSESTVHTVQSSVKLEASLKYSEDAIFASIEVSAKASVAHFGQHTTTKSVTDTISIDNRGGQASYVMFEGVTRYTGTAHYYNCVSHTPQGIGTVQITHSAPWQSYSGTGGGAVQCGASTTSALAKAAQKYC